MSSCLASMVKEDMTYGPMRMKDVEKHSRDRCGNCVRDGEM